MSLSLVFIFQIVLLDEVGKFVNSMVVWSRISAIKVVVGIVFLIIGEYLVKAAVAARIFITFVPTFKALELWL